MHMESVRERTLAAGKEGKDRMMSGPITVCKTRLIRMNLSLVSPASEMKEK